MLNNPFPYSDDNLRYHSYNYYLKHKYQHKVSKVPLDAHFTCPNRDGHLSYGGCRYCSSRGSGDFVSDNSIDLNTQYNQGLKIMQKKWENAYGIAYFQAYSNTYAPLDYLKAIFEPFINRDDVIELAIATRCDCLDLEKIKYLAQLNKIKPITIELGLQSIHDETMDALNCHHHYKEFQDTFYLLKKYQLRVTVHIINGLPNETKEMMLETAKELSRLNPDGIKIHMLNILKDSYLYDDYLKKPFPLLSLEEYVEIVVKQLELLNPKMVIERLTGDGLANNLYAPEWIKKKTIVLNEITKLQRKLDSYQGKYYET